MIALLTARYRSILTPWYAPRTRIVSLNSLLALLRYLILFKPRLEFHAGLIGVGGLVMLRQCKGALTCPPRP